jgi:glutamate formiminotransferase/formiminotetrahydrofolate cyclodeaminase
MPSFSDLSISAFLDRLASPEPTPGGGTAAAVAGGMAAALLMMVAGLKKTRTDAEGERVELNEARAALASVRHRIMVLADQDTEAYDSVIAAYRLPKSTDEEKTARKQAIQRGMRAATDTPLETLRTTADAMRHACTIAQHAHSAAASDVRVALELLEAAAAGAAANVQTNLPALEDDAFRTEAAGHIVELTNRITADAAAARTALP